MSLFPFSQPVYKLRVALDIKGFIVRVDHLSRQRTGRLLHKAQHRIVHRDLRPAAPLRIVRRDHRRLLYTALRRLDALAAEDNMAAVYLLRVHPVIRTPAKLCCQLIVLDIAAANKHLKPVIGDEAQRSLSLRLVRLGVLPVLDEAGRDKLAAYVRNVLFALRALQQFKHAVEIVKLLFALGGELCKMLLSGLHFAVFLEERRRVLLRRL